MPCVSCIEKLVPVQNVYEIRVVNYKYYQQQICIHIIITQHKKIKYLGKCKDHWSTDAVVYRG